MAENDNLLAPLNEKLEALKKRQENLAAEMRELGEEISQFKNSQKSGAFVPEDFLLEHNPEILTEEDNQTPKVTPPFRTFNPQLDIEHPNYPSSQTAWHPRAKSDLEKFIGENLINKIGIAITLIGVAIGAKYSIDHDLISPLARIILGYLVGLGLLGIGIKLKKNYHNYSAVLVSGGIATLYFITYFAYSLYKLFPQPIAFLLMVAFTAYAVATAIRYSRQIIAHIGMVGAYAVPFLFGDKSGSIIILFSYIAIINIGILIISINKYWKPVYYVSFILSWLTYFSWYSQRFQSGEDSDLALTFLSVFFVIFYTVFLAYKLFKREQFEVSDVFLLLANSFIFYGLGYSILKNNESGEHLLGLYTLFNSLIHFGVCFIIQSQKLTDKNLFYLIAGLVLVFITIAIPVQLNGRWVTLLWACEAALLFWIGRSKNVQFYEIIGYFLIILTFISIIQDWSTVYSSYITDKPETRIIPLFNLNFLTSLIVMASFGFINILNFNQKYPKVIISNNELKGIISFLIPATLLIIIYYSFRIEIETYWNQLHTDFLKVEGPLNPGSSENFRNADLLKFKSVWIINYSLLISSLLIFLNIKVLKSDHLGIVALVFSTLFIVFFLVQGLSDLSQLRESYIGQTLSTHRLGFNIGIRYVSFAFVGLSLYLMYKYSKQDFTKGTAHVLRVGFDFLLHITLLWIASSELISWMDLMKFTQSSKLGLTILWGVYSLVLIVLGIWKKKKYIRIGAISLFGLTLYKLILIDLIELDTIAKTIVFLSLGVLLLIISFLYNKYKHLISD